MSRADLAGDGAWGTLGARERDREQVDAFVSAWTARYPRDDILALCEQAQVPCGPVYSIQEIFQDPQYRARENLIEVDDERAGTVVVPNVVPRLSETPGRIEALGPALGADNEAVFGGLLGLTPDDLDSFVRAGII